jgi:hypothetical protein
MMEGSTGAPGASSATASATGLRGRYTPYANMVPFGSAATAKPSDSASGS